MPSKHEPSTLDGAGDGASARPHQLVGLSVDHDGRQRFSVPAEAAAAEDRGEVALTPAGRGPVVPSIASARTRSSDAG